MTNAAAEAATIIVILLNMNSSSAFCGAGVGTLFLVAGNVSAGPDHGPACFIVNVNADTACFAGAIYGRSCPPGCGVLTPTLHQFGPVRKNRPTREPVRPEDDPANQAKWMVLVSM
jgi:hypothetical protein